MRGVGIQDHLRPVGRDVSGVIFVPGAAGIVVSNLTTASTLGDMKIEDMARDLTAVQILDRNRQRLAAMGVDHCAAMAISVNTHAQYLEQIHWFAEEVMPHCR